MKKEFLKTAVLTLLVVSSLILSANIWYEKELWFEDYNSFVYSLKNFFRVNRAEGFSDLDEIIYWSEFSPEFISFTYGSQKKVIYQASPEFEKASRIATQVTDTLSKEGSIVPVTDEEYLNTYKTNSMMLKFPKEINLCEYFKKNDTFFDSVKEPFVSTVVVGIDAGQTYLSFRDEKTMHAYRMPVKTSVLPETVQELLRNIEQSDSYAFELNFDVKKDETERILFERFVPITLGETKIRSLKAERVNYSSLYDEIFKSFQIVKNSARTYRDKENTVHFIENRSTLKIYENATFSFEANSRESGVTLGNRKEQEAVIQFVNLLYRSVLPESDAVLGLFRVDKRAKETEYQFIYTTKNGFLFCENGPAVRVVVQNGVLTQYEQQLLLVELTDNTETVPSVIEAYDSLYNNEDFKTKSKLTVCSMIPCKIMRGTEAKAGWVCEFSDHSLSYFVP